MKSFWNDLLYAARGLGRRPVFTVVAVLTLALGIGANTALFSVIHQILLSPPPYPDPERLVMLRSWTMDDAGGPPHLMNWSYPVYEDFRSRSSSFENVAAFAGWSFNLTGHGEPERIPIEMVSAQYFPILGVQAARGRVFRPEEDKTKGTHPVALISHDLWNRRFGSDPGILGRPVHLEGLPLTVVGVMPRGFKGLTGQAEIWVPMMMSPELLMPRRLEMRQSHWHQVVGRLKAGLVPAQADGELERFFETDSARLMARAVPLQEDRTEPSLARALVLLLGAVGLVLLIACVNVVNLLLVRASGRQRETAIRVALGSDRSRLVRLFVAESVLLGLLGGGVGALFALSGIRLASHFAPVTASSGPYEVASRDALALGSVQLGAGVLGLNFLLALLAGTLLGLLPAFRAARADVNAWVQQGSGGGGLSLARLRRRSNPLGLLVVAEIALSLLLLVGAGLMVRSFLQLHATRLGFEPENLLTLRLSHPFHGPEGPEQALFYERLLGEVQALPGVEKASVTNRLPLSIAGEASTVAIAGRPLPADAEPPTAGVHMVSANQFETLRIPVLRGRAFTGQDREGSGRVAILNATAAERLFPGQNPLGQRIRLGIGWEEEEYAEIVGIVGDVKYGTLEEPVGPDVHVPYAQNPYAQVFLVARTRREPGALVPEIRKAVLRLAPDVPVYDAKTLEERIADTTSKRRFGTLLLSLFAAVACLLAAIGLYGVMAYSISGRTREIGIRVALGATAERVSRMIVRDGLLLAVLGVALGAALAFASTRLLASFLYQSSPTDPLTFLGAALLLLIVSLAASYIPARRALEVDPRVALQQE